MIYVSVITGFIASLITGLTVGGMIQRRPSAGGQLFSFILLMLLFNALWIGSYLYAVRRLHRQFRQIRALWIFEIFIMLIFAAAFFDMQLIIGKFTCVYIILMTLLNIFLLQHYQETGIAAARRK